MVKDSVATLTNYENALQSQVDSMTETVNSFETQFAEQAALEQAQDQTLTDLKNQLSSNNGILSQVDSLDAFGFDTYDFKLVDRGDT